LTTTDSKDDPVWTIFVAAPSREESNALTSNYISSLDEYSICDEIPQIELEHLNETDAEDWQEVSEPLDVKKKTRCFFKNKGWFNGTVASVTFSPSLSLIRFHVDNGVEGVSSLNKNKLNEAQKHFEMQTTMQNQ